MRDDARVGEVVDPGFLGFSHSNHEREEVVQNAHRVGDVHDTRIL